MLIDGLFDPDSDPDPDADKAGMVLPTDSNHYSIHPPVSRCLLLSVGASCTRDVALPEAAGQIAVRNRSHSLKVSVVSVGASCTREGSLLLIGCSEAA